MSAQEAPVEVGQVLAGKYRVERVLGAGGMGVVVAATHLQLDEAVALKFLLPDALKNPEVVERFAREARAAAKIKSEHVARVVDVGELPSGSPYLVLEYLEGEDLSRHLSRHGQLPVVDAVSFVLQACDAIAEAHSRGIIHRDLKPSNLFLTTRSGGPPVVKVLDFGISKLVTGIEDEGKLTQTQSVLGSPMYMPPEQMTSARDADARSDIWSLGAILYELLTGGTPFTGTTITELIVGVLNTPVTPPRAKRGDLPEALDAAIVRCLAKQRDGRFANVAELALAIAPFGGEDDRRLVNRIVQLVGGGAGSVGPRMSLVDALPAVDTRASLKQSGNTVHIGTPLPGDDRTEFAASRASDAGDIARGTAVGVTMATLPGTPAGVGQKTPLVAVSLIGGIFASLVVVVVLVLRANASTPPPAAGAGAAVGLPASADLPSATVEIAPRPSETAIAPAASVQSALPSAPTGAVAAASARGAHVGPPGHVVPAVASAKAPLSAAPSLTKPPAVAPAPTPSNKLKMDMKE